MANKRSPTNRATDPTRTDDLKLINGIGPAVEKRLNGVGIFTFAQLTALSPADITAAVADIAGLSAERIIKQDWIGQAHKLAAKSMQADVQADVEAPLEPQAPIEEHALSATQTIEPQQPTTESIASEATKEMGASAVTEQINNSTAPAEIPAPSEVHASEATLSIESEKIAVPSPVSPEAELPDHMLTITKESESLTSIAASSRLAGTLRLREIVLIKAESSSPSRLLPSDTPFDVRITLDLSDLQVPDNTTLYYKASIYGKNLGSSSGQVVGEAEGTIKQADTVTINVEGTPLAEGSYKLLATVIVALLNTKLIIKPGTTASIGNRVQIY